MSLRKFNLFFLVILFLLQISILANSPGDQINLDKMHPKFRSLITNDNSAAIFKVGNTKFGEDNISALNQERFGAIIKTDNIDALRSAGVNVIAEHDGFVTAKVTLDEIGMISRIQPVSFIDAPSVSYPVMNISTPETGASLLHSGFYNSTSYKGAGAIVVIFDSGIDYNHIDFKNLADTTKSRILYIWDQTLNAISGESSPAAPLNYGVEYTQAQIEDEIDGTPAGFVRQKDTNGHGTHVAGTAVGSGFKFTGIAPEADIIVIKGGNGSFSSDDIINGLAYAETKASALGKPVVVNLSLGGQQGAHDGSQSQEQAIDAFNSKSGQVAVVAAGNDGDENIHISGVASSGSSATIRIFVPFGYTPNPGAENDEIRFDLWYDENVSVTAKVTSPNGITYERGYNTDGSPLNNDDGTIYLDNRNVDGIKQNIFLYIGDEVEAKPPMAGTWILELIDASGALNFDGWLAKYDIGENPENYALLRDGNNEKSVAMPGTADKAITVGAYVTKTSWPALNGFQYLYPDDDFEGGIADFSSLGPTRDNRMKPEITAPGKGTVSSYSMDSESSETSMNPDGKHILSQGTSMATPHVAGSAAILLAIAPTLTADQMITLMGNTAQQDTETGLSPGNIWGYGKLDILSAVVAQVSGDSEAHRSYIRYYTDVNGPYYYDFTGTTKLAVRYTAPRDGRITGAKFDLILNNKDAEYYPAVDGDGDLLVSVYTDNSGIPGDKIGNTVTWPFAMLDAGTNNYINMLDADVSVVKDQYFHLVLERSNTSDGLVFIFDDANGNNPDNPSLIHVFKTWDTFNSTFGAPYNMPLMCEITNIEDVSTVEPINNNVASSYELMQNYPNPFNPSTSIRFSLTQMGKVDLIIFDILGREVITLVNDVINPGIHEVQWDSQNASGYRVPTGVYFYRLRSQEGVLTKKMLLVK